MNYFISHYSAAYYWNIPNLDIVLNSILGPTHKEKYIKGDIIDITVTDRNKRRKKRGYNSHYCSSNLPAGAIQKRGTEFIASPELVFLQLANYLDIHQLILFGLQICSHKPGKPSEALTTARKIAKLLDQTKGCHGNKKASRALRYIKDGSNSILESITYMILTLPPSLGGYGLSGAIFNQEILLADGRCFVDLYYKEMKLAIEYDSFDNHKTATDQGRDSIRATKIELQGIDVFRIVTIQLYDKAQCRNVVTNLASKLGKRIRIQNKNFYSAHNRIREFLPRKK